MRRRREDVVELALREAARRILESPSEAVSFAALATDLHLSKDALSRRFKRTLHVPYRRFLRQARIERGCRLLTTSALSVTAVVFIGQTAGLSVGDPEPEPEPAPTGPNR
jgi:AraC-like DNA-binding protein